MAADTTRTGPRRLNGPVISTAFRPQGGVVFDCDGVLTDTIACWDDSFACVAGRFGVALSQDQLAELRGASLTTAAERLAQWSPRPPRRDDMLTMLTEQLVGAIDTAELLLAEGARALLDELYGVVCLGVASNSPRAVLLHILARLEITTYFAAAVSAEDVPHPKPAPDPYLAACAALGIDPRASVAVEDSDIGMRSAIAAGLTVIELTGPPELRQSHPGRAHRSPSALQVTSLADPRIGPLVRRSTAAGDSR